MTKRRRPANAYPEEQRQWIYDNYKGVGNKELAERFNKKFGTNKTPRQISAWKKNHNLNSGLTGQFPKGHYPANPIQKGQHLSPATQFKKGQRPPNWKPVGTLITHADGYVYIKVQNHGIQRERWKPLHRIMWEKEHGPIPEGHILTFIDGNKNNVTLENLMLITLGQNAILNRQNLRVEGDADLNQLAISLSGLISAIREQEKEQEEGN